MSFRLIVNADDFGLTRGVNDGIVDAHLRGIVTATTLMAHGAAFDHAVELARANPSLDVGVHLVLWDDTALPQRLPLFVMRAMKMSTAEITRLFSEQIARVRSAGIAPSHVDTHKHTHTLPHVTRAMLAAAREHGIAWVRRPLFRPAWRPPQDMRATDHFAGLDLTGKMTRASLGRTLERLREGLTELMCHPGYNDADLTASPTRLTASRAAEIDALTAPEIRELLAAKGVALVNYRNP
jgi:predicted glycoside hydrolase/deacetylase ChbG (UPF0249 family)